MYKFLMVDDEEIVRRGFRRKIDWKSLEFEFLEPCENGEQAIEAIETLHPDVVMTDIYMPRVDGLAVAAYAAEHHPDIIIVILSGYDEFEYAQKAIKANVFEYVLKPVTSRDLGGLLERVRVKLDADRRSRQEANALRKQATIASSLLKTRSLVGLVTGASGGSRRGRVPGAVRLFTRGPCLLRRGCRAGSGGQRAARRRRVPFKRRRGGGAVRASRPFLLPRRGPRSPAGLRAGRLFRGQDCGCTGRKDRGRVQPLPGGRDRRAVRKLGRSCPVLRGGNRRAVLQARPRAGEGFPLRARG